MISIVRTKKYGMDRKHVYFASDIKHENQSMDIIYFCQSSIRRKNSKIFKTLHIDLRQSIEDIYNDFDRRTKKGIKSAKMLPEVEYTILENPDDNDISDFRLFYNKFAHSRSLPSCDYSLLIDIKEKKALAISFACQNTEKLCSHLYIVDGNRARIYYSCSLYKTMKSHTDKNRIASYNRLLHWKDMQYFKDAGLSTYDFGGLSTTGSNALLKINEFKLGFGGNIVYEYNHYIALTVKGHFMLFMKNLIDRFNLRYYNE